MPQSGDTYRNAVTISASNTSRDGSGAAGPLVDACDGPIDIDLVRAQAAGTVTDGTVRIFWEIAGHPKRLIKEIQVTATSPSDTLTAWGDDWKIDTYDEFPLSLGRGDRLWASTDNADTINVFALGEYR